MQRQRCQQSGRCGLLAQYRLAGDDPTETADPVHAFDFQPARRRHPLACAASPMNPFELACSA
jgi:hypothetical protein